jgi:pimeloyl-ACP methyl ester carboxylesterase
MNLFIQVHASTSEQQHLPDWFSGRAFYWLSFLFFTEDTTCIANSRFFCIFVQTYLIHQIANIYCHSISIPQTKELMKINYLSKNLILMALGCCFLIGISCQKAESPNVHFEAEVRYAEISNAKLAYKVLGRGEPLVLCMGYANNMDMWSEPALEMLEKHYKVIVFDYRGMGYSTTTDTSLSIKRMAIDIQELLNVLKINKTHVLGWSMGGYVAQEFALNYPEMVDKLILYASNPGDTITINPNDEIIAILSNPASTPYEFLSTLFPDDWLATHPEPWLVMPEGKEPINGQAIGLQYEAIQAWLSPGGGSSGRLHQLSMPILLLCGNHDKVVPAMNSKILADSIQSASLLMLNGTGHGLQYQQPEAFANYVLAFLNGKSSY